MNNTVLLSTEREKDVGVIVSSDMKVSEQCGIAARKVNHVIIELDQKKYSIQG